MWWATWWAWIAGALVLAILEVVLPGFVFLGFAFGAAITGGLIWIGGPGVPFVGGSLPALLVLFAVLSLVAWFLLRRMVGVTRAQVKTFDEDINDL